MGRGGTTAPPRRPAGLMASSAARHGAMAWKPRQPLGIRSPLRAGFNSSNEMAKSTVCCSSCDAPFRLGDSCRRLEGTCAISFPWMVSEPSSCCGPASTLAAAPSSSSRSALTDRTDRPDDLLPGQERIDRQRVRQAHSTIPCCGGKSRGLIGSYGWALATRARMKRFQPAEDAGRAFACSDGKARAESCSGGKTTRCDAR